MCHSLHWECGLKPILRVKRLQCWSHSLHWECGLKPNAAPSTFVTFTSLPSLGVWIETRRLGHEALFAESLPSLGVWIETAALRQSPHTALCHSLHWECGLKQLG